MTKAFASVEYCDGLYADTSFVIEELYHKAQALVSQFCDKYGLEVMAPQVLAALDAVKAVVYGAVKVVKYIRDACTTLLEFLGIL
jgi:hypothetical protein